MNVILEDGTPHSFFLKVAEGDTGHGLVHGEWEAAKALHSIAPDFVPRPMAAGSYQTNPNMHFYLSDYIDMIEELPDVQKFCATLAKMHRDSILTSTNGKFGFHAVTYNGNLP